jgi:hypothetical protein
MLLELTHQRLPIRPRRHFHNVRVDLRYGIYASRTVTPQDLIERFVSKSGPRLHKKPRRGIRVRAVRYIAAAEYCAGQYKPRWPTHTINLGAAGIPW